MKIFLLQDIKNLGRKGETKDVNDGYARNFLFPKNLAVLPKDAAVAEVKKEKDEKLHELKEANKIIEEKLANINGKTFVFKAKADKNGHLYGSIGPKEIAEKVGVSENLIKDHFKSLGEFHIKVPVSPDLVGEISIVIEREK